MTPVPGVVGAVVAVEHVVAGVLQIPDCAFRLFHIPACLSEIFSGKSALTESLRFGDHTVAQGNGEILPAFLLDGPDDLHREAVPVLEGAAVFIRPVIYVGQGKLIEEISFMNSVDLDAVHSGILQLLRGFRERIDVLADFVDAQSSGRDFVRPAVRSWAGGCGDFIQIHDRF